MKKSPFDLADWMPCFAILAVSFSVCVLIFATGWKISHRAPRFAVVAVNGVEVRRLPLNERADIILNETHIRIRGGAVNFEAANCPDQNCVKGGRIRQIGSALACLHNKIVIQIVSGE